MRHLAEERLAALALGDEEPLSRTDRAHLRVCRACTDSLADLRAIVATGRDGAVPLRAPRPAVFAAIQTELADDAHQASTTTEAAPVPLPRRARPPRRFATAAVAAATLMAVSLAGVLWWRQAGEEVPVVIARATLAPLPDHAGRGTAELVERGGATELDLTVETDARADGYQELWLINSDGRRMISLGVVPPDGRASYPVPSAPGGLDGYATVDISAEPFDGVVTHSRDSLLRGTLS